ncbi:MAG TPA: sulfotransferase family protein [Octadecabacter sp.]|nr:sulfotransferase family protein [Octadecabacter sp.]
MKIAMWSGPRNLSTAMMYAFGNRADFTAMDEPFYAPYLATTGLNHPMSDEIVRTHETGPQAVAVACSDVGEKPHKYMKHMPHHMLEGFPLDWASDCVNIHLIRHPARVIASYAAKRDNPTLTDIGYPQQAALYDRIGGIVIDSHDIRQDPENAIKSLCIKINLPYDSAMLNWQAGPRAFDGIWASHWYGAVHKSTGFAGAEGPLPELEGAAAELLDAALPYYEKLKSFS